MMNVSPAAALASAHLLNLGALAARPVPRSLIGGAPIRADSSDPKALFENLQKGVTALREEIDSKITAKDGEHAQKIDRINASITEMQTAFEDMGRKLAAAQLQPGAGGVGDLPPTDPDYVAAFKGWMRNGNEPSMAIREKVKAAMTKDPAENGGYLAPIEWDRTLTGRLKLLSPIREHARVQTISTAGFKKLFTDRAVGSGWVGETAPRPATSTPQIGTLDFLTGELYANPAISQQMLDDAAVNLEQWLSNEVETEFSRQEGISFLSGNGANKPFGILTYVVGGANENKHPWGGIPVTPSGAAAEFTADAFIKMFYDLPSQFGGNAKVFLNRLSVGRARVLKDGQGNYLWQPSYQLGQPQTLLGAPIVEVPDMPLVAAGNIAALYGDMDATYLVIDRLGINVLRDPFTNKPYIHFYTVKRVGGAVYNPEPMRALKIAAS